MFDPKKIFEAMQQMAQLQKKLQDDFKLKTSEGESGGGMVKVIINGHFQIQKIEIEPNLIDVKQKALLQDLIQSAVNNASKNMQEILLNEMKNLQNLLR